MSQEPTLTMLALPGQPIDYELELLKANGEPYIPRRIFSGRKPERVGVLEGITTIIDGGGACKNVSFSGRKDLIAGDYAQVVRVKMNDGFGWQPVGFGALSTGHAAPSLESYGDLVRPYNADCDSLLRASVVTGRWDFPPQDVAGILRFLLPRYLHPALIYDANLIPNTGTRFTSETTISGYNMLALFEEMAKRVQEIQGVSVSYGVGADGKVFFRVPTGSHPIPYEASLYRELPLDMTNLCSSVFWVIGNTPNVGNIGGNYTPGELNYHAIPDPALEASLRRPKELQVDGDPFRAIAAASFTSDGFSNPADGSNSNANGERVLGTTAQRTGTTGTPYYHIHSTYSAQADRDEVGGLPIFGATIRYRQDTDVTTQAVLFLYYRVYKYNGPGDIDKTESAETVARHPLPYTAGVFQDYPVKLPQPRAFYDDLTGFTFLAVYGFKSARVQVGTVGTFHISDFRFMCLDTVFLTNAARRELKVPAGEAATLKSTYLTDEGLKGRHVPSVPFITQPGRPGGSVLLPVAEIRHSFNAEAGYGCAVDVGNPARDGEDATLERVAAGIERSAERTLLKTGGTL